MPPVKNGSPRLSVAGGCRQGNFIAAPLLTAATGEGADLDRASSTLNEEGLRLKRSTRPPATGLYEINANNAFYDEYRRNPYLMFQDSGGGAVPHAARYQDVSCRREVKHWAARRLPDPAAITLTSPCVLARAFLVV